MLTTTGPGPCREPGAVQKTREVGKNQPTRKIEKQEKLPRLQIFNSGSSDGWTMDYLNDGWLVRDHRRGRKHRASALAIGNRSSST